MERYKKIIYFLFFGVIPLYAVYLQWMNWQYLEANNKLESWNNGLKALYVQSDNYYGAILNQNEALWNFHDAISKQDDALVEKYQKEVKKSTIDIENEQKKMDDAIRSSDLLEKQLGISKNSL